MKIIAPDEIVTDRLLLRKPIMADANAIFANYAQDETVTHFLTWPPHKNLNETIGFIKLSIQGWNTGANFPYCICLKNDNVPIGMIGATIDDTKAMIGYVLAKQYWNNGYMQEALMSTIAWLLENVHIYRVWAGCDVENIVSKKVMEKAGMSFEGIFRKYQVLPNISEEPRDCCIYASCK
jgi:ribosomal-protein-alanine N-acetyltransferase